MSFVIKFLAESQIDRSLVTTKKEKIRINQLLQKKAIFRIWNSQKKKQITFYWCLKSYLSNVHLIVGEDLYMQKIYKRALNLNLLKFKIRINLKISLFPRDFLDTFFSSRNFCKIAYFREQILIKTQPEESSLIKLNQINFFSLQNHVLLSKGKQFFHKNNLHTPNSNS